MNTILSFNDDNAIKGSIKLLYKISTGNIVEETVFNFNNMQFASLSSTRHKARNNPYGYLIVDYFKLREKNYEETSYLYKLIKTNKNKIVLMQDHDPTKMRKKVVISYDKKKNTFNFKNIIEKKVNFLIFSKYIEIANDSYAIDLRNNTNKPLEIQINFDIPRLPQKDDSAVIYDNKEFINTIKNQKIAKFLAVTSTINTIFVAIGIACVLGGVVSNPILLISIFIAVLSASIIVGSKSILFIKTKNEKIKATQKLLLEQFKNNTEQSLYNNQSQSQSQVQSETNNDSIYSTNDCPIPSGSSSGPCVMPPPESVNFAVKPLSKQEQRDYTFWVRNAGIGHRHK